MLANLVYSGCAVGRSGNATEPDARLDLAKEDLADRQAAGVTQVREQRDEPPRRRLAGVAAAGGLAEEQVMRLTTRAPHCAAQ